MKKANLETIVKGIEINNSSVDFSVSDGVLSYTGFKGSRGYLAKLGSAVLASIGKACEVRTIEKTGFSEKGRPFTEISLDVSKLKEDDVLYLIKLASDAHKKHRDNYNNSEEGKAKKASKAK